MELLSRPGKSTPVEEALNKARSRVFIVAVKNPRTGVVGAAFPTLLISQGMLAAAGCKNSDWSALQTVTDIASKLSMVPVGDDAAMSREGGEGKEGGIDAFLHALEVGCAAAVRVRARLVDDAQADNELCVARCQPLHDDAGDVTHMICTVAGAESQRFDSPSPARNDDAKTSVRRVKNGGKAAEAAEEGAVEESVWHCSDLGYVQDGDAFLRQVVDSKARLFASDDKVAARIAEFIVDAAVCFLFFLRKWMSHWLLLLLMLLWKGGAECTHCLCCCYCCRSPPCRRRCCCCRSCCGGGYRCCCCGKWVMRAHRCRVLVCWSFLSLSASESLCLSLCLCLQCAAADSIVAVSLSVSVSVA